MTSTQVETLGDSLVLDAFKHPGGVNAAYDRIVRVVGQHFGSRNTFRKFLTARSAEDLNDKDKLRLWLLVAAFGNEPAAYGVPDEIVPASMDPEQLKRALFQIDDDPDGGVPSESAGKITQK